MKALVFIDSNVWFSAFYKEGVCSKLLKIVESPKYQANISELVLEEIIRNIQLKIPVTLSYFLDYLKKHKIVVLKNPHFKLLEKYKKLAHFEDLPIIISATESNCNYFITGNVKDFNLSLIKKVSKVKILTPSDFLSQI